MNDLIETEIDRLGGMLRQMTPTKDDYMRTLEALTALQNLKAKIEKDEPKKSSFLETVMNNQALLSSLTSLAGIILVINHERINVITSKAFNIVRFK